MRCVSVEWGHVIGQDIWELGSICWGVGVEKLMVMWGVGEDEMKGRHGLPTTPVYTVLSNYIYIYMCVYSPRPPRKKITWSLLMMYWAQLTNQQAFLVTTRPPKKKVHQGSNQTPRSNEWLHHPRTPRWELTATNCLQNQSIFLSWDDGTATGSIKQNKLYIYMRLSDKW